MKNVQKSNNVRRLFIDIETSPNVVLAFRAGYDVTINHDAIVKERKIICIGYKWEHENNVHVIRWDKNQDDRELLAKFLPIAEEADEMIGHFIDRFDLPWLKTRCLIHGLPPFPIAKTIDTKAWAAKNFYFNSNKLDYISQVLGHGAKLHTDFSLWKKIVIDKDEKSLDYMCKYCGVDIKRLESVYHDLKVYCPTKTHAGVKAGNDKWSCPRCGSTNVTMSKKRVTAHGVVQYQFQCQEDGGYYTVSSKAYEDFKTEQKRLSTLRRTPAQRNR